MKTIFANTDTQRDFWAPERYYGKLSIPGTRGIEAQLEKLTELAREGGYQVLNFADYHTADSKEISNDPDFKTTFPAHCLRGTKGALFIPETTPVDPYIVDYKAKGFDRAKVQNSRDIIVYKDDFSAFVGNPHTGVILDTMAPDRVILYGVATDVCVDMQLTGMRGKGIEVVVAQDAIKELPGANVEDILARWETLGAKLATTATIEKYLR